MHLYVYYIKETCINILVTELNSKIGLTADLVVTRNYPPPPPSPNEAFRTEGENIVQFFPLLTAAHHD